MTLLLPCKDDNNEHSCSKTQYEKAQIITHQLKSQIIRPNEEVREEKIISAPGNQLNITKQLKANKITAKTSQVQVEKSKSSPGTRLKDRKRRWRFKHRSNRYNGKASKKIVLMVYLAVLGQNAQCLVTTAIDTSPIVSGDDVILKCTCEDDYFSTMHWLKGSNKQHITAGNFSLQPIKYTSRVDQEGGENIYFLTIQKFSLADVDSYVCECGFSSGVLKLTVSEDMIYLPMNDDTSMNISDTHDAEGETVGIHFRIHRIYPKPKCTVFYENNEILNTVTISMNEISALYMVDINVMGVDCYGFFNVTCSVGSRNYSRSEVVDQCHLGKKKKIVRMIIVGISAFVAIGLTVLFIVWLCRNYLGGQNKIEKIRHLNKIVYQKLRLQK